MDVKGGKGKEDERDAFGRALNPVSRKRDRSASSSSDSSDSLDDAAKKKGVKGVQKKKQKAKEKLPPRKKRMRTRRSRSRSSPRKRLPRRNERREKRSRSRTPPRGRKKPKSFKDFITKLPDDISPEKAQTEYKKYLNQFDKSREAIFFNEHKDEDWFKLKYDPLHVEEVNRTRGEHAREEAKKFVQEFLDGKLKNVLNTDCEKKPEVAPLLENTFLTADTTGEETAADNEGNAKDKADAVASGDVEMTDVTPENTTEPSETEKPPEEPNPVEPNPVEPNPVEPKPVEPKPVEPEPEAEISMKKPGEMRPGSMEFRGPRSTNGLSDSRDQYRENQRFCHDNTVFIRGIPLATKAAVLTKVFETAKGFKKLLLSDPARGDQKIVNGWAVFETQEDCQAVMSEEAQNGLNGKRISTSYYLTLFPKNKNRQRVFYVHQVFLHPERITQDLKQCLVLIHKFDEENEIHDHKVFSEEMLEPMDSDLYRLNLCLQYLWRVHLMAYYQARRFKSPEQMQQKIHQIEVRNRGEFSRGTKVSELFENEKEVDAFYQAEVDNEAGKIHEKSWEERQREKLATENTKEVKKASKYRCALCRKAFKGAPYVRKHILLKHEPIVVMYLGKQKEKEILSNYSKDRKKITAAWFQVDESRLHHRGRFNNRRGGRFQHRGDRGNRFNRRLDFPNKTMTMDAPPPHKFDHGAPMLKTSDTVRTVKSYDGVGDDLGIDDLLDFGFGDFEKGPKFNL